MFKICLQLTSVMHMQHKIGKGLSLHIINICIYPHGLQEINCFHRLELYFVCYCKYVTQTGNSRRWQPTLTKPTSIVVFQTQVKNQYTSIPLTMCTLCWSTWINIWQILHYSGVLKLYAAKLLPESVTFYLQFKSFHYKKWRLLNCSHFVSVSMLNHVSKSGHW